MQPIVRYSLTLLALLGATLTSTAAESQKTESSFSYVPEFHGTLRPRMELSTTDGDTRFQLRNARVSLNGAIAPTIDYFMQADVCDRGSMKFLDGWIRLGIGKGLKFQAGQFRMPFAVDPFRGPHTYIFANRSFIGKQVFNYRAVGAKASYTLPRTPLTLEAGAFNPSKIGDHTPWNHTLAYSAKAVYRAGDLSLSAGYASIRPQAVRMNVIDGAVTWQSGRWLAEAEYMHTHYTHDRHKANHAYNTYLDYRMPVKAGIFNRLSFQGRFDGMTAHSSGATDEDGRIVTDNQPRNRVTVGTTISYLRTKSMFLDIRANYEKYFYHSGVSAPADANDKVALEMVLRF